MKKFIFITIFVVFAPFLARAAYDADFQKGYNFPSWWFDSYSQSWSDDSFKELLAHKPGWIAVGPFWYQKDKYATTIYANAKRTANDAGVEHVIKMAHDNGVKVMLKPSVDAEGGDWRGGFKPKDANAWFASYTAMAVHYAKMAQRLNVESYLIGAEYVTLSGAQYSQKWREVATAIRKEYSGPIGYGANWDNQKGTPEFELINWWDAVDFIGIHAYFPLSKTNAATLDDMLKGIEPWVARVQAVQAKYAKSIIFTEAGYKSCDGGTRIPWWCNPKAAVDLQEQSDGTEAILRAFQDKPWFKGIFWWMWNQKPWHGGLNDKDHDMNRKPVMEMIKKYWGAATTSTLPPPVIPPNVPPDDPQPVKGPTEEQSSTTPLRTERDSTPPGPATNVSISREGKSIVLTWTDPSDEDFESIIILRNNGGATPIDGGRIYGRVAAGVQKFIDTAVDVDRAYRYVLRAEDLRSNVELNMDVHEMTVPAPPPLAPQFPPFVPFAPVPLLRLPPMRVLYAAEKPEAPVYTTPQKAPVKKISSKESIYGISRKSSAEERAAEKRMWRLVGKSFKWRQPKLKPGEWTTALRAYLYGGYPIDVVRDFLHHKRGVQIDPKRSWKELQTSTKKP